MDFWKKDYFKLLNCFKFETKNSSEKEQRFIDALDAFNGGTGVLGTTNLVGCYARRTVAPLGKNVVFLSFFGLRETSPFSDQFAIPFTADRCEVCNIVQMLKYFLE